MNLIGKKLSVTGIVPDADHVYIYLNSDGKIVLRDHEENERILSFISDLKEYSEERTILNNIVTIGTGTWNFQSSENTIGEGLEIFLDNSTPQRIYINNLNFDQVGLIQSTDLLKITVTGTASYDGDIILDLTSPFSYWIDDNGDGTYRFRNTNLMLGTSETGSCVVFSIQYLIMNSGSFNDNLEGKTITVTDSVSNNGEFTVISNNENTIFVQEIVTEENDSECDIKYIDGFSNDIVEHNLNSNVIAFVGKNGNPVNIQTNITVIDANSFQIGGLADGEVLAIYVKAL